MPTYRSACGCESMGTLDPVFTPCAKHRAEEEARGRQVARTFIRARKVRWQGEELFLSSLAPNGRSYWLYRRPGESCFWVDKLPLERQNRELTIALNHKGAELGTLSTLDAEPLLSPAAAAEVESEAYLRRCLAASSEPLSLTELRKGAPSASALSSAVLNLIDSGEIRRTPDMRLERTAKR